MLLRVHSSREFPFWVCALLLACGFPVSPALRAEESSSAVFLRGLNLNGPAVTIDGHLWDGRDATNYVCQDKAFSNSTVPLIPPTDPSRSEMLRSSRWGGNRVELRDVPSGKCSVFLYVWEDNNSETYSISVNGKRVLAGFQSGSAGEWRKLGPWLVEVKDGSIVISSQGGAANFSGIELWRGIHDGEPVHAPISEEDLAFFEMRIRPLLVNHCYECHSTDSDDPQGELLVDSRLAIRRGGVTGPAVIPGDVEHSLLLRAVRYKDDAIAMPPAGRLSDTEIADLESWIQRGAPDPRSTATRFVRKTIDFEQAREFWAFQPVVRPPIPQVRDQSWPINPIDHFILRELERRELSPLDTADKRTLIRRATFDLTGLPPTPTDIADFLADNSPEAFSQVIERLLGSQQYGERWGRHWMDLVRYADTAGDNSDYPIPQAYLYRNYIIDSLNADKPYDQFLREQIAGDLLPFESEAQRNAQLIATGYLATSRRFGSLIKDYPQHLTIEDTIDNLGRTVLGLTISCARCHDHKFDPIAQDDYYGLYGIFESTRYPFPGIELDKKPRDFVPLWEHGQPSNALAYAMSEGQPGDARIHQKGEPTKPGDEVSRHFLGVLGGQTLPDEAANQSGRLQLADWLTDPRNPLTARVMVNRIWQQHFGSGLVKTPSDFGHRGLPPTHPELLDWLADRFIAEGWSLKQMHRLMMSSRTYQLASRVSEHHSSEKMRAIQLDPDNDWNWKFTRRRLDAESLRDALLAIGGNLDESMMVEPHPFPPVEKWQFTQHHPFRGNYPSVRRSVYLMTARVTAAPFFTTFDGADRNATTPRRDNSVTTIQALYLLNDELLHQQAELVASRLLEERTDDDGRLNDAFELMLGRPPTAEQRTTVNAFLVATREKQAASGMPSDERDRQTWSSLARVLFRTNEFLHVD